MAPNAMLDVGENLFRDRVKRWIVTRLVYLKSGRTMGCFHSPEKSPRSKELILVLEASGGCLSYSYGDGEIFQEITKFVKEEMYKPVLLTLDFRNRMAQVPYMNEDIMAMAKACGREKPVLNLGYRMRCIRWPADLKKCTTLPNGRKMLGSIDGNSFMVLSADGSTYSLNTLTPLSNHEEDFRYTPLTQEGYSCSPWRNHEMPLKMLLNRPSASSLSYISQDVVRTPFEADEVSWQSQSSVKDVLLSSSAYGLPKEDIIVLEWTKRATFHATDQNVTVHVAADNSKFRLGRNGFVTHKLLKSERVYAPDGVPRVIRCVENHQYEFQTLVDHASALLPDPAVSSELHQVELPPKAIFPEEQHIHGFGRFTRTKDNCIKVVFNDRTILISDRDFKTCEIIRGSDASVVIVSTAKPLQDYKYVRAAKNFFEWTNRAGHMQGSKYRSPDVIRSFEIQRAIENVKRQRAIVAITLDRVNAVS